MTLLFLGGGAVGAAIASGTLDTLAGVTVSVVHPDVGKARGKLQHERFEVFAWLDHALDATVSPAAM